MGFIVKCTKYSVFVIQFVVKLLYNLWRFCYIICGKIIIQFVDLPVMEVYPVL